MGHEIGHAYLQPRAEHAAHRGCIDRCVGDSAEPRAATPAGGRCDCREPNRAANGGWLRRRS